MPYSKSSLTSSAQAQSLSSLHNQALKIAKDLATQEFLMIEILQKIDHEKVFRFLGFKSLFQYATLGLGLPENRAYTFILVARKSAQIDKLQDALKSGQITLSKAKRIAPVITHENAVEWLKVSKTSSQRCLERAVAKVNPRSLVEEGTRFISENMLELKAAVSIETEQLLKRVEDLLCQSKNRTVTKDEVFHAMARFFLEKKDPVERAKRVLAAGVKRVYSKQSKQVPSFQTSSELSNEEGKSQRLVNVHQRTHEQQLVDDQDVIHERQSVGDQDLTHEQQLADDQHMTHEQQSKTLKRQSLSRQLKHQVHLRDRGRCQARELHGKTCGESRWVDLHHKHPVSLGGNNTIKNLVTLCKAHHRMEHIIQT